QREKSSGTSRLGGGHGSTMELGGGERCPKREAFSGAPCAACGGERVLGRQRSGRAVGGRSVWRFRRVASRWRKGGQVLQCVYVGSPGGRPMPGNPHLAIPGPDTGCGQHSASGGGEPALNRRWNRQVPQCRRRCQRSRTRRPGSGPAAEADDCALAALLSPTSDLAPRGISRGRQVAPPTSPPP